MRTLAIISPIAAALTAALAFAIELGESPGPVPLETLDGLRFEMNNYGERPATAVVFLSSRCPVTAEIIEPVNDLHEKYRLRDVLYVGVCSNSAETGDELRRFTQRRGVIFPVYRDPDGAVAEQFGATVTPEVFLLDRTGTLVYHGGLDGDEAFAALESAVVSILSRRSVTTADTPRHGTPIDRPAPKPSEEATDPYGAPWFASELVFERIPGAPAHHCSTIAEAGNGDLVCVWYGGSYESSDDQVLFLSRRAAGERTWSPPEVVVRNPGQPPGNAVVFADGPSRLWIVWGRMESARPIRRGSGWGQCRLMFRVSDDHGRTWSEDGMLDESLWCLPRNVPIRLADGALALPLSGRIDGGSASFFLMTSDGGASWERSGLFRGGSQPTMIQRKDGSLLALLRHRPEIIECESRDGGQTWSEPRGTGLKNPGAGIAMTRLANGHLVLVFNDSTSARTPLSIARSTDEGRSWEAPLELESNPGEYSYPCVIQTADGRIHVSYTFRRYSIKHVELNEDWLVHFERPD